MGTVLTLAFAALVPILVVAFVAYFIYVVVRRGFELKQLLTDGVETSGTVVSKRRHRSSRAGTTHQLIYQYHDPLGRAHKHASLVTSDVYDAHEEGRPIEVICSASRPEVSAPKYLVEHARPAWERRRRGKEGPGGATGV